MDGPALPPALPAESFDLSSPAGRLRVYRAQPQQPSATALPPLLLIHSVNAAASAAEVAPLFAHYRSRREVWALDLPGYGGSDRSDRAYTLRMMTDAVAAVITQMCRQADVGAVDVLAVSLGCEFAARAATEAPQRIRRLALVSPTGLQGGRRRDGPPGADLGVPWLYRFLTRPGWSEAIFRNLTRPGVIRYFLRRTWGARDIDEPLWRYAVLTTRQPGARHAPLRFVSAYLFSRDVHAVYRAVRCPVWVSMATRGDFTDYRARSLLQDRPNWAFRAVQGGALPYFEPGSGFFPLLDAFWAEAAPAALH